MKYFGAEQTIKPGWFSDDNGPRDSVESAGSTVADAAGCRTVGLQAGCHVDGDQIGKADDSATTDIFQFRVYISDDRRGILGRGLSHRQSQVYHLLS